jgi:hypothetical protein
MSNFSRKRTLDLAFSAAARVLVTLAVRLDLDEIVCLCLVMDSSVTE